ncbi:hypothetical protein [Chamaesiphon sp. VAR_48_metabat_403]|nr:hypothetical protein [Chamaesiphon sp. VAR_48_metabat_403]
MLNEAITYVAQSNGLLKGRSLPSFITNGLDKLDTSRLRVSLPDRILVI